MLRLFLGLDLKDAFSNLCFQRSLHVDLILLLTPMLLIHVKIQLIRLKFQSAIGVPFRLGLNRRRRCLLVEEVAR